MSNKEKMILVGNSLLNSRKKIIDCNSNIPDSQGNEGYLFSACYLNNKNNTYEYQYAYEKDYIESVYKNIFGTKENFDTSFLENDVNIDKTIINLKIDNVKIIEKKEYFIIYLIKNMFYVLPKENFSSDEINLIKENFSNNLNSKFIINI